MAETTKWTRAAKVAKKTKTAKVKATTKTKSVAPKTKVTAKSGGIKVKTSVSQPALSPLQRLRSLHFTQVILNTGLGLLVLGFTTTTSVAVMLGIQAKDEFASQQNVVLGPALEVLYHIDPKLVLFAGFLFSAAASLFLATKLRPKYEAALNGGVSGFRWLTLGFSGAIMLTAVNLLAGVNNIATLKLSASMVLGAAILAWLAERDNLKAPHPKWLAYILSLLAGALAWFPLVGALIGTSLYGEERFGWHVYALSVVLLASFTYFATRQYNSTRKSQTTGFVESEIRYFQVDAIAKIAFALIVLTALQ